MTWEFHIPPPQWPIIWVNTFKVFRDGLVADAGDGEVGFWEVL